MMIKDRNDLQQLIHILQQQFPNEKNVPIKDSLDSVLNFTHKLNMLVDVGMLDGRVLLNFIKTMLVLQGLLESHSGMGELTVTKAYDRVMDDGEAASWDMVGLGDKEAYSPPDHSMANAKVGKSTFESLRRDLTPVSDRELIGMMAAQELGLKGGPADGE
jgi:hypothetical protein